MKKVYFLILIMVIFIISGCSSEAEIENISQKEIVQIQKKDDTNYSHGMKLVETEQKGLSKKAYTNEATKYAQLENQLQKIMQETNPEGDVTLK